MEQIRLVGILAAALVASLLPASAPATAQVMEGLRQQAESAVVHKGGQVIREAIDCALGEPKCEKEQSSAPVAPDAANSTPAEGSAAQAAAPGALPSAAPDLVREFTATVTPWITRDAQGWDHLEERIVFTGDAVVGEVRDAEHHIVLCDGAHKWKATLQFYFADDAGIQPGDYPIVKRVQAGTTVMAGFFMPLATTFQEGTVTIDAAGPAIVTGTVRATYAASKYLRLQSGTAPDVHTVEASFRARVVSTITKETAPACYWE
jgi:hypothetical protein